MKHSSIMYFFTTGMFKTLLRFQIFSLNLPHWADLVNKKFAPLKKKLTGKKKI